MKKNDKDKKPDFVLKFCHACIQMTNHINNQCQKCKIVKNAKSK